MKWGEVKAFVESDMTDQELYEQLGRNRKELKEWLEQNKDGKTPYDKFTVAPAVASRAAESMIPWETPAVQPTPEVGVAPPITGMESAFVPTPSQTPTLADDLKNFYRRGVSGTAKAQNKQEIIEERAKQAGIMDATGKITDTEKYNALDEQVNRELEETGDAAPAANTRLFATSGTTSNNGNQQTYSVAGARKTLAGSNTIGALVTAKGLTSEDFRFMSLQEKGKEGGVSENVLNNFLAERISSGSLLKSDTYRITDNQGNTYDISKSDYNKIKKLAGEGKVDEIDKILQPYVEAAARDTGPTRAMFESDQAQRARQDAFSDRSPLLKRPPPIDASARQQAEIEAGNLVEEDNAPQVEGNKPRKSLGLTERERNEIQQMKERNRKLREAAQSLGLDPNKVTGRFEGGKLTGIIDETGKQVDVSDRLSEEDKKSVNAARSMRAAMQGTQQSAPQVEPADKAQRPATATVMESTETFDAAALAEKDPETHRKYVERLREIVREREKELENVPFNRQSVARSKIQAEARMQAQEEFFSQAAKVGAASRQTSIASVNERGDSAVVRESMGVQQTQQPTPQVEAAKPKEDETRPVSAAESFLMQQKGLDPNNEFDRKLYRRMDRTENRREQQRMRSQGYAPVDERGRVVGAELNTMSVQNNDLQRQGNSPSSQPIVIQNNSAPSTQTTVTPPAQPRVDSSFSRVMDIRNFWD
jgi:hypothetical protein